MSSNPRRIRESRTPESASRLFSFPARIYWEDTDAGGVVYHARYLHFFERARTEWFRASGYSQHTLRKEAGVVFVVHRMDIAFNAPARLDDLLTATVMAGERRSASFVVHQHLLRDNESKLLVEASVRIACVDADTFRPRPIPDHLLMLQEIAKS
ncbi:MAG: tol-pal system-associated acyl-CoA thioesterase [Dokdonella sp.]|uniref:tol-pal system-associated acyl-CoA thioesterase n=1 Tax=Dokdonella sp. TaxID=2291710 RepID=UPI00326668C9